MLPITVPYEHALPAHSFEIREGDSVCLQRQAHTLRLEGDYVGAQRLERQLKDPIESFVRAIGRAYSVGQNA